MIEDPTLIDAAGTVTAAAAIYVAGKARSIAETVGGLETAIYGTDEDDGNEGIAMLAIDGDRRSRANLKRLRRADGIQLEYDPDDPATVRAD